MRQKYPCAKCGIKVRELHGLEFCYKCFMKGQTSMRVELARPKLLKCKSVKKKNG